MGTLGLKPWRPFKNLDWVVKIQTFSVQTFPPISLIYKKGDFIIQISIIYLPLSYPFKSLGRLGDVFEDVILPALKQ